MIRGVIFDLDGTLIDSLPCHFQAWKSLLAEFGVGYTKSAFAREIGPSTRELMAARIRRHQLPLSVEEGVRRKEELFQTLLLRGPVLFPGVRRMLTQLQKTFALAVATSASRALTESLLRRAGIRRRFKAVVTSDDVPRTKPAPDVFVEAARRLGLAPGDCAGVDDAPSGIAAAGAAGLFVIGVVTSFGRRRLSGSDAVVTRTADVPALLRESVAPRPAGGTSRARRRRRKSG